MAIFSIRPVKKKDRRNFYIIARGSVFECSSLVSFLCDEGEIAACRKEQLCSRYEEISKILFAVIKRPRAEEHRSPSVSRSLLLACRQAISQTFLIVHYIEPTTSHS
jgi:hypothetical protein